MGSTRKKVLWVDDEIEFLRAHIMFLETRGYSVVPVFGGDDAIALIREKPHEFDIVLLDEQMPGKNGLATLEVIKELAPDLPVVMVTKSEEERLMDDAFGKKIDGYLTKPVNPSQILSVCKRMIDSKEIISTQISQRFVRSYSENRLNLSGGFDARGWIRLYENLVKWDFELEEVQDEGLRQTHAGQKSDCNKLFSNFVSEHYASWIKGRDDPPLFSVNVVEKFVAPLLNKGRRVFFVVLDCMRLDQYIAIESLLRPHYDIDRNYYYSVLPSSTAFARNALFSGMYPQEVEARHPGLYAEIDEEGERHNRLEGTLLTERLRGLGVSMPREPRFAMVNNSEDSQTLLKSLGDMVHDPIVTLVVNFVDLLSHSRSTSKILREIAPDESAFRSLTKSWFQYSTFFQILKEIAQQDCTVVLTTDHGSVFCTRGTEMYGAKDLAKGRRYKIGKRITSDERHTVFLTDPAVYKLPSPYPDACCAIAKENYYFIGPDKFENYQRQYQNTFQHGGISMEEVIVPLAVMTPKR